MSRFEFLSFTKRMNTFIWVMFKWAVWITLIHTGHYVNMAVGN